MTISEFRFGPFDGKRLLLPFRESPWPSFVIPKWNSLQIETFYLFAGWHPDHARLALYIYDENPFGPDIISE